MMSRTRYPLTTALFLSAILGMPAVSSARDRWTKEEANAWSAKAPWLVGCNYIPSNAINQLEMWQAATFDPKTIDRELGWAEGLGFNSVRVFLHHLLWEQDRAGLLKRMDEFLAIADRHHIGVMFVPLDAVWDPFPRLGPQRAPKPGVHNSGWVQSPGAELLKDPARHDELKGYIEGVIGRFKDDRRVHAWDLFNEPDNTNGSSYGRQEPRNKHDLSLALLKKVFAWARAADPSQPLTSGVWVGDWSEGKISPIGRFQLDASDVISFHSYNPPDHLKARVEPLLKYDRPLLCTEYMARPEGSTFGSVLPLLKGRKIGAYCWGFVAGKSQTNYPWSTWQKPATGEPAVWFHDIFRPDGSAYDKEEVVAIRRLTGKTP